MARSNKLTYKNGFTIIELLVVIIVIGILATIVTVAYNGIQSGARDKSVLSDLDTLDGIETDYGLKNGGVSVAWYSGSGVNSNLNFTPSTGNIIDIVANSKDYCIRAYNPNSATYKTLTTAATKESTTGACASLAASAAAYTAAGMTAPNGGVVTTLAGSGTGGSANGTGTTATFNYPAGLAVDPTSGSVDVLEANNDDLRSITTSGVVTTIATSLPGSPWGMTVNPSGTIYYATTYSQGIAQVTPAGVATIFAGGTYGCSDGTGTGAQFSRTLGVASDTAGNLYVADLDSDTIRKITPSAVVTTFAGTCNASGSTNGTGLAARFNGPYNIAIDSSGNLYVADSGNNMIRKITSSGVVTTLAGSGTAGYADGTGSAAQFSSPAGVAVDATGNVYVADTGNNRIREITPAGVVSTLAGSGTSGSNNGTGTAARFNFPNGIAVSASGVVYIADTGNNLIRQIQ
jgi:prepilin-type N-terminal cleavage/methylation domain-containing protein